MNVILRENLHDQAFIDARCDAASFQQLRGDGAAGQVPAREHREGHRRAGAREVVRAARLLGQAEEDLDPVREGRHLVGHPERRGDELVRQPRAAARQHRPAGPGVRPPGRPPERLHVRLRLAAPAGRRRSPQPLAGAREGHDRLPDRRHLQPAAHAAADHPAARSSSSGSRSSSTSTSAPRTSPRSPTSCCPPRPGASTPTRARTSSGGCASTSSSTTRPARCAPST